MLLLLADIEEKSKKRGNSMAFCMNCGKQLPDGAKFCLECGTKLGDINADQTTQRETTYEGKIYKCPNCGDILDAYETVCDSCGYELRGRKASSVVEAFAAKLDQIESEPFVAPRGVKPGMVAYGMLRAERKINLIRSFPIPNNKEDLFEFAIMAASNFETDYWNMTDSQKAVSDAWKAKFEQAYQKAQISFKNDKDFASLQALYSQKLTQKKSGLIKNGLLIALPFIALVLVLLLMRLM